MSHVAAMPRRVPVLIEYRKGDRRARSVCFVLSEEDGLVVGAGTLDGDQAMGIVTILVRTIVRWTRLDETGGGGL